MDHCARLSGGEIALANIIAATDVDAHVILGEDGPLVRRLHDAGISVEVLPLPESARELRKDQVDVGRLGLLGPLRTALYVPRLARAAAGAAARPGAHQHAQERAVRVASPLGSRACP